MDVGSIDEVMGGESSLVGMELACALAGGVEGSPVSSIEEDSSTRELASTEEGSLIREVSSTGEEFQPRLRLMLERS